MHTWSLSVEEMYYLVWPWCLLLLHRVNGIWRRLPELAATAGAAVYVAAALLYETEKVAYYLPVFRVGGILWGCALALWVQREGRGPGWLDRCSSWPGLPWVLVAVAVLGSQDGFNRTSFLVSLPSLSLASLIVIVRAREGQVRQGLTVRLLSSRTIGYLGVASYSIYLWHMLVIQWTQPVDEWGQLRFTLPLRYGLIVVVGLISFRLFERPFIAGPKKHGSAHNSA